jgi:transcriptional regulator GlxA family with amidase domain
MPPQPPHRVSLVVYDGFQLLDASGPASVYGAANDFLAHEGLNTAPYELTMVSTQGGPIMSSCGLAMVTLSIRDVDPARLDSMFIVGGETNGLRTASADSALQDWVRAACKSAARAGAICAGSGILASWDLIGTRRFATHWASVPYIRRHWPHLNLDGESIFVQDGQLWTSAGVTTGIDMTLAIVERDHGAALARAIAQRLVLAVRRPGWQSQFSPLLAAQAGRDGRYADLIAWIATHLDQPLSVDTLAARTGESLRSFHRNFTVACGCTPAQFIVRHRIDHARALIEDGTPLKQVAKATGFASVGRLSAAFQKVVGMSANEWRLVHGG